MVRIRRLFKYITASPADTADPPSPADAADPDLGE